MCTCTNKMIPTLAPIKELIRGRAANLPSELQQIILHFACCHPCAVLVRNSADYIAKFIKPPIHTFFDWGTWVPHHQHNHYHYHNYDIIEHGPSLVGPIVPMQPYMDVFWIPPPPPPPPRKKKCQQNNLIKAQRKHRYRSQKSNNRLNKRQRR